MGWPPLNWAAFSSFVHCVDFYLPSSGLFSIPSNKNPSRPKNSRWTIASIVSTQYNVSVVCSLYPNPGRSSFRRSAKMFRACSPALFTCTLGFRRIRSFRFGDFACHLSHPPRYSALLQTCFPLSLVNFYLPFHELLNFLSSNFPGESGSELCVSIVLVMPQQLIKICLVGYLLHSFSTSLNTHARSV